MIGPRQDKIISAIVPKFYPEVEVRQLMGGGGQRIYIWGLVKYDDAFGITRTVRFGQSFFWLADAQTVMSTDTTKHNDAD
jgi:hypothetical protein